MVKKELILIILVSTTLLSIRGYGQASSEEKSHHHRNEISIATGIVPLPAENELTMGFHLHYIRGVGKEGRFGLGLGLETIIDEHKHYTASVVFQYNIYKGLIVGYSPGVMMRKEGNQNLFQFAQHIETAYEFELGEFHIGPMAELGIEQIGVHYMVGIHVGIDF